MSTLGARCVLVTVAVVLVAVGVLAPLSGGARVVLIVGGASCALLDRALVRSSDVAAVQHTVPVVPGPGAVPSPDDGRSVGTDDEQVVRPDDERVVRPDDERAGGLDDERAGGPHDVTRPPRGSPAASSHPPPVLVLGRAPDGAAVTAPASARVVVTGRGALATAVFRALVAQLPSASDVGITRTAADAELTRVDAERPLGDGLAVSVRLHDDGRRAASVVLVPGLGAFPRGWDVAVQVSRHGCVVRRRGRAEPGTRVAPTLPQLDEVDAPDVPRPRRAVTPTGP